MNKMYYYPTNKEHLVATLKVLAIIACIIVFAFMFCSCNSQSGKLSKIEPEKVVIIDSQQTLYSTDIARTEYKVKRISKGVVTWISLPGKPKFEQGDTIYYKFTN
jgi:hypothetical protein